MPTYIITEKAGRFVAGHRNTGVGTALEIPAIAAEYEIILGTLRAADEPAPVDMTAQQVDMTAQPVAPVEPAPVDDVPVAPAPAVPPVSRKSKK